jgi:peroxiredoxin
LHPGAGQRGEDTAAPTTFFIDNQGMVRSLFRPRQVISRLSAKEVLAAVDAELGGGK